MTPAKFSIHEKRVLQMMSDDLDNPESHALRKILDVFPWMLDVAECNFDARVADAALIAQSHLIRFQTVVADYQESKKKKDPES